MLAALSLDWNSKLVQQVLRLLLDAARAHTQVQFAGQRFS